MKTKFRSLIAMLSLTLTGLATLGATPSAQAQVLSNETARYYLPAATSFPQTLIDSFNSASNYQYDILNGQALTYPDLTPIQLTWNGVDAWETPTAVALTTHFTTLLQVGPLSHTAVTPQPGQTNAQVTVNWDDVPGVTQYRLRFRALGGTWNPSTITGSERTFTTLAFNTTYEAQARVYLNSTTQGEYTQTYTFTTPQAPAPLPTCNAPVVTGNLTNTTLSLSWPAVPYATGYQIETRELGAATWGGTTITGTSFTQSVQANKAYEYRVRTACTGCQTGWSNFSTIGTKTTAICSPPTNHMVTVNGNQVTFTFTPNPYANATQIEAGLVNSTATYPWGGTTIPGNTRTFYLANGYYRWRVRSTCLNTVNNSWTPFSYGSNFTVGPVAQTFLTDPTDPNPSETNQNEVIYDMSGRKLNTTRDQLPAGIYIINGRQVGIVK